ncbi:MAG: glycoside hydrolase family 15 protein [Actinomycetota bacterium]|nr:glycoside hydrolase family 15 protein [Actinomycetota bacterium]
MVKGEGAERYPPIGEYALLADCFSAALVSRSGSIDWCCLRRFDNASVFGRLLDWDRGGFYSLAPRAIWGTSRRYVDDSLVLETTVVTATGRARISDAFVVRRGGSIEPPHRLLRVVDGLEGSVVVDVVIEPRFDYAALRPWIRRHAGGAYSAIGGDDAVVISSDVELQVDHENHRLSGSFQVSVGERVRFSLDSQLPHLLDTTPVTKEKIDQALDGTRRWWEDWQHQTVADGPQAPLVRRSAAVLKGLTCAPTGAIIAAPTTSLPEQLGGVRNWDYRYAWIRDSALTVEALTLVGHPEVAQGFLDFVMRSAAGHADDLQIMYGCYGARRLVEVQLENLEGYRGSRPVRVGNAASGQVQLDSYAHILVLARQWHDSKDFDEDEWRFLSSVADAAASRWREPDHGLWEVRGPPRHFVHSKVMLWQALESGIQLARQCGQQGPEERWRDACDEIRETIQRRGVHPTGYYVQHFDGTEVDASLLQLPMLGFVDANDPVMRRTVEVIQQRLSVPPHGLLRRYLPDKAPDGLQGSEGVFLTCTFWLVDVLLRQGRRDEAQALFDRATQTANDLGLFSEELDPITRELLGNFPQAFTHVGFIVAARDLAMRGRPQHPSSAPDEV